MDDLTEAGKRLLADLIEWEQREYGSESDEESHALHGAAVVAVELEAVAREHHRLARVVRTSLRSLIVSDAASPDMNGEWVDRAALLALLEHESTRAAARTYGRPHDGEHE